MADQDDPRLSTHIGCNLPIGHTLKSARPLLRDGGVGRGYGRTDPVISPCCTWTTRPGCPPSTVVIAR